METSNNAVPQSCCSPRPVLNQIIIHYPIFNNREEKKTVGCFLSYFILQLAPPTVKRKQVQKSARAGVFKFKPIGSSLYRRAEVISTKD